MNIVLVTGIYPPDIGGPATYVCSLAEELKKHKHEVTVLTYAHRKSEIRNPKSEIPIIRVHKSVPIVRWFLYALALRKHAKDADIVYAFSSVSVGVPLILAHLKKSKKLLRLGGDFIWERYTARGGMMSLKEWYESLHWSLRLSHRFMHWLLNRFDYIVFSTRLQEEIYEDFYQSLPSHCVIENAIPESSKQKAVSRKQNDLFRLLFMGRFVGFKNLFTLLDAVKDIPHVALTLVGEGPLKKNILAKILRDGVGDRVTVQGAVYGDEKNEVLNAHDLLIIPSTTEISPNTALEAKAADLPVLLTAETGLSDDLKQGMIIRNLQTTEDIEKAVLEVQQNYPVFAKACVGDVAGRTWKNVYEEHLALFKKIV